MRFRHKQTPRGARLEGWGGPMVRDAAHEAAKSGEPILPAPHHEAGRDRGCIKLIGICFSVRCKFLFGRHHGARFLLREYRQAHEQQLHAGVRAQRKLLAARERRVLAQRLAIHRALALQHEADLDAAA
jgi:hypothetical protein